MSIVRDRDRSVLYDLVTMSVAGDNRGPIEQFPYQDQLIGLFETLTDVMFCAKDSDGVYVDVNSAFVRRTGKSSKREVIGTTAADHFIAELAERYEEQDRVVIAQAQPLRDELELIRRTNGELGWYLTTKLPVSAPGDSGEIMGLVSVSRDLLTPSAEAVAIEGLQQVVAHVRQHFGEKIAPSDLAGSAQCSVAQLERRMRRVFGVSATQYVLRVRVDAAAALLAQSSEPLASVATLCGFYDQPDFTRRFARLTNATPAEFRAAHRSSSR
jgi:PAS domain S-box-containing protein